MWQRFTERARRVVFFAQEEAGRLGENYVSTEHLLLGLVRENDSVAARILDRAGVSLGRIRTEIERQVTRGEGRLGQDMQLTPRAKRVIDLSYDEARQLSNNYIGTEHLLLGLIREAEGLAGRVLAKLSVDLDKIRELVREVQNQEAGSANQPEPGPEPGGSAATPGSSRSLADEIYKEAGKATSGHRVQAILDGTPLWRNKSLLGMAGLTLAQVNLVLDTADLLKVLHRRRSKAFTFAYPATLALLFEKPSLRTRTSFEAGMAQLGGAAVYLAPGDVGLGTRESVEDVAGGLSRWVDIIAARVFDHNTVEELSKHATIPVINALSDREHPLQMFADMLTIKERCGTLGNNLKIAYVGDGNNVLNSLLLTCATLGVNLTAACPEGYAPDPWFVAEAQRTAVDTNSGAIIDVVQDPTAAVIEANAVYTDVWTSMGQEAEAEERRALFAPFTVNAELIGMAKPGAFALHCLPAHRGEEITAEVMDEHKSVILEQAENRLHTQKALILLMLGLQ